MKHRPLLAEYGRFHEDGRNRVCHEIGIPLIVLAVDALLRLVRVGPLDLAFVVIVGVALYYARLAGRDASAAVFGLFALYFLAGYVSWPFAIGAFVIGWLFQIVGHAYEGKRPAFLENLQHLLVGPLWIGVMLTSKRA